MKKTIVANWKMNPQTWAEAEGILGFVNEEFDPAKKADLSLVVCPPFIFLEEVGRILESGNLQKYAELGAQDLAESGSGSWTGEVSAPMLRRIGARYVIIGHSERRWKIGESDDIVNKKLKTALESELIPIVCIGERERGAGYVDFLSKQIEATFAGLSEDQKGKCLIAYEPVWAISTNPNAKPDRPEDTLKAAAVIKEILGPVPILYGGSVTASNARQFLDLPEMAGVLVGGASVRKEEFVEILRAACK